MREIILDAVHRHAEGHIAKHVANIEVYLNHSVGIGEHPDVVEAIELELTKIGEYQNQLDLLDRYFPHHPQVI